MIGRSNWNWNNGAKCTCVRSGLKVTKCAYAAEEEGCQGAEKEKNCTSIGSSVVKNYKREGKKRFAEKSNRNR